MRKSEQHATQRGTHIHSPSHKSQFIEAYGPVMFKQVEIHNKSHLGLKVFSSARSELEIEKSTSFVTDALRLTTSLPTTLHLASGRPAHAMHAMPNGLPVPFDGGSKGKAQRSIIIDSSGEILMVTPMPVNLAATGLFNAKQEPSTTGVDLATTTAATAGATTSVAAGAADAAPVGGTVAAGGDAAGAGGDAGVGGWFFTILLAVVIVVFVVALVVVKAKGKELVQKPSEPRGRRSLLRTTGEKYRKLPLGTSTTKEAREGEDSSEDEDSEQDLTAGLASMVKADSYSVHRKSLSRSLSDKSWRRPPSFLGQSSSKPNVQPGLGRSSSQPSGLFSVQESIQSEIQAQAESNGQEINI